MPEIYSRPPANIGRGLTSSVIDPVSMRELAAYNALTPKQRIDLEKIYRAGHVHPYSFDEWVTWTGNNYIKSWYDVQVNDDVVLFHMWPNAGKLSGKGQCYSAEDNVKVRLSKTAPF